MDCFKRHLGSARDELVGEAVDGDGVGLWDTRAACFLLRHVAQLVVHLRGGHSRVGMEVRSEGECECLLGEALLDGLVVAHLDGFVHHVREGHEGIVVEELVSALSRSRHRAFGRRGGVFLGIRFMSLCRGDRFGERVARLRLREGVTGGLELTLGDQITPCPGNCGFGDPQSDHCLGLRFCGMCK